MVKILNRFWFTSGSKTIGIISTENEFKERKTYIGLASGGDEKSDAMNIADWGSTVPVRDLINFLIDSITK